MDQLWIQLDWDVESNEFCYRTNIKDNLVPNIILDYLRLQIGKGKDLTEREEHYLYSIDLFLDLNKDSFSCTNNCGNLGLRDGILLGFCERLNNG